MKSRSIRLISTPQPGLPGTVEITMEARPELYWIRRIAVASGAAYELAKRSGAPGNSYAVLLDSEEGHHSCECLGFLRWDRCKHVEGLIALRRAGKL